LIPFVSPKPRKAAVAIRGIFAFPGHLTERMMAPFPDQARPPMVTGVRSVSHDEPLPAGETVELLNRVKQGDREALEALLARCLPPLRRWAHGRLPSSARGMFDTADLVQEAVIKAMRRLEVFESRHQGALQAYLRVAVMNHIRDLVDQQRRRPRWAGLPSHLPADDSSPLEHAIGAERMSRYEAALARLGPADREAIVARLELQYSYDDLATLLDKPTADAARMAVTRAMRRLADEIRHAG
jgi:RNA polymerase sigma-70 factor, ECF subfamily